MQSTKFEESLLGLQLKLAVACSCQVMSVAGGQECW